MRNKLIIGVLTLTSVLGILWGYQEHQEKVQLEIEAENQYQSAYSELAYNIDLLHDKLGTTLAMSSRNSLSPALTEVWKIATESQQNIGELPITLLPFQYTQEYLTDVGNFSYKIAVRDMNEVPLSVEEFNSLKQMYQRSNEIEDQIRDVQYQIATNNLKWIDVGKQLKSGETLNGNAVIDGFTQVENKTKSYSVENMSASNNSTSSTSFPYIKDKKATELQVKEVVTKLIRPTKLKIKEINKSLDGAVDSFYHVTLSSPETDKEIYLSVLEKGAHPIYFINNRVIGEQVLSVDDAIKVADTFLVDKEYSNMELSEVTQFENTVVMSYIKKVNSISIYPETIQFKIALDDGDIVGFNARDYLVNNHVRDIQNPTISVNDAKEKINQNVEIMENNLAIIINDFEEEVLCYRFLGKIDTDTYEIFINAKSGKEEKVTKLQNIEKVHE